MTITASCIFFKNTSVTRVPVLWCTAVVGVRVLNDKSSVVFVFILQNAFADFSHGATAGWGLGQRWTNQLFVLRHNMSCFAFLRPSISSSANHCAACIVVRRC